MWAKWRLPNSLGAILAKIKLKSLNTIIMETIVFLLLFLSICLEDHPCDMGFLFLITITVKSLCVGVIIFGSVRFLSKKVTKPNFIFFEKKNRNRTETRSNRPVSVRFGFLGQKLPVWLGFSGFGSVFSILARFLRFGSVFRFGSGFFPVFCRFRFGFFGFLVIKPKPNRTGRFFQKFNRFNRFFFSVRFFQLFFFRFSRFNRFSSFFAHPYLCVLCSEIFPFRIYNGCGSCQCCRACENCIRNEGSDSACH